MICTGMSQMSSKCISCGFEPWLTTGSKGEPICLACKRMWRAAVWFDWDRYCTRTVENDKTYLGY